MLRLLAIAWAIYAGSAFAQQELDLAYGADAVRIERIAGSDVSFLDKGEGQPVLFHHPDQAVFEWQWMMEAVAPRYRTVVNGPLPAVGPPFGADALIAFLETLDIGPVHLVAHSFGGRQAMTLATDRPDLLRSLILVEPAGAPTLEGIDAQERDLLSGGYTCDLPEGLRNGVEVDQFRCLLMVQINEPGFLRNAPTTLVRYLVENTGESVAPAEQNTQPGAIPLGWASLLPPICDELKNLDVPVLFVRGELTPELIQSNLDGYEACLPPHRSVTISDSGHFPHIYNPEEFSAVLLEFLSEH